MNRVWGSAAFRLALGCGVLAIGTTLVVSAVFYFGTIGIMAHRADTKLQVLSDRLVEHYRTRGVDAVRREIERLLSDGIDQDTEAYELMGPDLNKIAGNLSGWTPSPAEVGEFEDRGVVRQDQPSVSRLLTRLLPDGAIIIVGRDLHDQLEIERVIRHALAIGAGCAVAVAVLGALLFRRRLEARIAGIRHTAHEIEAGDLRRRIPLAGVEDEFTRLGRDINRMLDQIEHLMEGVRHVSNAIAHDLRTPLGRIRNQLEEALRPARRAQLAETAGAAIGQIDELIRIFDRLLQIAEAESGTRRQSFVPVLIEPMIADVLELYDAAAEERGIELVSQVDPNAATPGDKNLVASAVANLVENAIKYAGDGATVRVYTSSSMRDGLAIVVEDNGPGIPEADRPHVVERFYRVDASRSVPGNGLGLSIVNSIASLHWGELRLEDACPGLRALLVLPRVSSVAASTKQPIERTALQPQA